MYATINLPGSSHFEYYGPASRQECENWLNTRTKKLAETEPVTSLLPQRIVSNKEAESWKYRDGSKVCTPQLSDTDLESAYDHLPYHACGCPGEAHYKSCPGYAGGIRAVQYKGDNHDSFIVPTDDGDYSIYHFSTAGNPDAHDTKSGEWFFQPNEDAPIGEVWSQGHRTPLAAITAAQREGAELALEKAVE